MITPLKQLIFSGVTRLDIGWLQKMSPLRLLSPYHHLVADEPVPYITPLYSYKNSRQFETDLDFMLRHFQPLRLGEIVEGRHLTLPKNKKGMLVCFDDGLRQAYEVAAPILLRKGVPAALFVVPEFVDNKTLFYNLKKGWMLHLLTGRNGGKEIFPQAARLLGRPIRNTSHLSYAIRNIDYRQPHLIEELSQLLDIDWASFVREYRPYMTVAQIKDWLSKGLDVGAHSIDHPLYADLPLDQQINQTLGSVDWVSTIFSPGYRAFAFPHVDRGVKDDFFRRMNPPHAPGLIFGNNTGMQEKHDFVLHRFIGENPAVPIEKMVKAVLAYSAFRKAIGRPYVRRS
jgi:peptidoglycan/xylan/chitin deacetylase (PgdA/CDA1 family)